MYDAQIRKANSPSSTEQKPPDEQSIENKNNPRTISPFNNVRK